MKEKVEAAVREIQEDLIRFTQDLVRIESITYHEEAVVRRIEEEMHKLGYDQVLVDSVGSVVGVMGNGPTRILFDSHIDTVAVGDRSKWERDPFSGDVEDGKLYGRGSSDMKSAGAASVYAAYVMKKTGILEGKTVYVCMTTMEEDQEGVALYNAITELGLKPDCAIICDTTTSRLAIGTRGRAMYQFRTSGITCHAGFPERGDNAAYKIPELLRRIEALGKEYMAVDGPHGSIAVTRIETDSVSLNAVPDACRVYADRRMKTDDTMDMLDAEMRKLAQGLDVEWGYFQDTFTTWTGKVITNEAIFPAWETPKDSPLVKACVAALTALTGTEPELYLKGGSTNGNATAGKLGIPSVIFGIGLESQCHIPNEYCLIQDILHGCAFYALFPAYFNK